MYGASTWQLPNHISTKKFKTNNQKANIYKGLKLLPLILLVSTNGNTNNIKIATNILITPNFGGFVALIACRNREWLCRICSGRAEFARED